MKKAPFLLLVTASITYTIFQSIIPSNINPLLSVFIMYITGLIFVLFLYFFKSDKHQPKEKNDWHIIIFAVFNIMIDLGFLLAFRAGWQIGMLNVASNIVVLISLAIIGIVFLKEKLSFINIIGIITGIIGLALLGF